MADVAHTIPLKDEGLTDRIATASPGAYTLHDASAVEALKDNGFSMDEIYRPVAPRRTLARRMQMKASRRSPCCHRKAARGLVEQELIRIEHGICARAMDIWRI